MHIFSKEKRMFPLLYPLNKTSETWRDFNLQEQLIAWKTLPLRLQQSAMAMLHLQG